MMDNPSRLLKVSRYVLEPSVSGLALVREFLKATLMPFPPAQPHVYDILSATHEACKNAIEHDPVARHPVDVACKVFEDVVVVKVSDRGNGFDPDILPPQPPDPEATTGWGLFLIYSLMDNVDIETGRDGTWVTMTKRL
ncbi:MAG: ATP-binding protein [Actinobacteria bacterium]|nr:ATP-binding protein [Actinomycetota bacterium]MCG2818109.1 ATP-binding protein [Actinomycetes bacterium]MBU4359685.1 ATP-binding protein [Actinomycetota bacterium]MBU4393231.1 ATP-binding protein [Actinomycetota bacterium]MBU4401138.1 ATP-binding protein [Actinomycetota bacterium]